MNPKVEDYIQANEKWRPALQELRTIVLACELTEELKWRIPCYTHGGANIVLISALKQCCTLSFTKGALLKDPRKILEKPGKNTRAARLIRFTSVSEITQIKSDLISYVQEAIQLEESGLKVDLNKESQLDLPQELQDKFDESPLLQAAFEALTPGRQRGYLLFFSSAKQSATRSNRIEKYRQRIHDGKGMNDCVCGLSQKMPGCDGSHNQR